MSIDAKRRAASAAFVVLLALSVVWPAPVVSINQLCCNAPLAVDDLSSFGREAPSWDVVYWSRAGVLVIAMLHGRAGGPPAVPPAAGRRRRADGGTAAEPAARRRLLAAALLA